MLAASLVALALSAAASAGPALHLSLSGARSFAGINKAVVKATLTNTGDEVAKVLNDPNTVLSKVETNTFAISNVQGVTPKFTGKFVKYTPSPERSFTLLKPGESVTVEHALGDAYDFTRTGAGNYSIETSSKFTLVTAKGLETIYADTSAHEASLSGALVKPELAVEKRITYNGCSSTRQTQLAQAARDAQAYAAESLSYLQSHTSSTSRYTTWFGTYTSARHTTVQNHYAALSSRNYSSYTYDCTCTESDTYAYTYSNRPGNIWLCGVFWQAPAKGTDSKAGTLVHESTHWSATAGTSDYAYGQSAAKSLAQRNPAQAVQNADSHEYFSENNPALS